MATKKLKQVRLETRQMNDEALKADIQASRTRVYDLRTQLVTAKVEDTAEIRRTRRHVARLLTERAARAKKAGK
ncbi:MAG: 50S ribosomal protein L29 [Planctomycetota bacterium]|nr:50S ribosomal protein L29 [Planctomycetota bacterium]